MINKEEIRLLIANNWTTPIPESLFTKFGRCRRDLIEWTKAQNASKVQEVKGKQDALEVALSALSPDIELIGSLTSQLANAYKEEELFWRQRSRIQWLQEGDKNSAFFHAVTRNRRAMNKLSVIEKEDGSEVFEEVQIASSISEYFNKLFSSASRNQFQVVEEAIQAQISPAMNDGLTRIPDLKEIHEAVLGIHEDKAPGPDGFSAGFYHTFWDIIGTDVSQEIKSFFERSCLDQRHNETHIRLIPKITGPKKVADYRPIALCSVHYKIIAKILAKRLQPWLSSLISIQQSAFVPNRAISDNVLITHEILHFLRTSEAKVHCAMAVKTDMSKAYDRIEWSFLQAVLRRFGFSEVWTAWVMECVSSVSYSSLINGSPQGKVKPTRGLRQGDPLSPYLFILCTEVLSGLCHNAQVRGTLPGIRVARKSPLINHLLFADDTMFFSKTSAKSCSTLLSILKRYEEASWQCINVAKSGITFSSKTPPEVKARVKQALGITMEGGVGKYLGLPEHFGRRKKDIFTGIVDKIRQKTLNWSTRFLSGAGKQVLLKAVSCFKLPISLCKRIQSAFTRLWWDDNPDKRKMCWVAWDKLTFPKEKGGLGLREIEVFNDALLAKIGWRLLKHPNSLLAQVLLGKYCHSTPFMEAKSPSTASHGWRGVLKGRDILVKGLGWILGNGKDVRVWNTPWLSASIPKCPTGPPSEEGADLMVTDLLLLNSTVWNLDAIRHYVPQHEEEIGKLVLSSLPKPDALRWLPVKAGAYTTKSGYELGKIHSKPESVESFSWSTNIWKVKTSPKLKMFMWKATCNALPLGSALANRGLTSAEVCKRCGEREDNIHLFLLGPFAAHVWELVPALLKPIPANLVSMKDLLVKARQMVSLPPVGIGHTPLYPWGLWFLWKARNALVFDGKIITAEETVGKALSEAKCWKEAKLSQAQPIRQPGQISQTNSQSDSISCFSDAAWRSSTCCGGFGWVIKNPQEVTILQGSSSRPSVASALMAEALAMKAAITAAIASSVSRLACFSDCQELVLLLKSEGYAVELDGILADIYLLSAKLISISFNFVPRSENGEADALAKLALLSFSVPSVSGG